MMKRLTRSLCALALGLALSAAHAGGFVPAYLTGNIAPQQSATLSQAKDVLVKVRLLDQSRQDAPPQLLAEQILGKPRSIPADFSLCYDKQAIKPDGRYVVEGQIFVNGELRYNSSRQTEVLRAGADEHPQLRLDTVGGN
ncbi:YbaY family lipoprotein [Chromobacterium haemolyticum]|uniref:Lipoprotein n=1 Tax=Chromobacterium haemolyticum TaxID=394935 RepID=A0A1W0DB60_9NEIS|nr:YbaY family lipoprotein [Chromobacterium haemolyticum]OQS44275.1 hypothetical protein B0T45_01365 [Chromobacterium haemolyticum]